MCDVQIERFVTGEISTCDSHAGLRSPVSPQRRAGSDAELLKAQPVTVTTAIVIEVIRRAVVGDVDIGPTVRVQIRDDDTDSLAVCGGHRRVGGDIGEGAVSLVVKETVRLGGIVLRTAGAGRPGRITTDFLGLQQVVNAVRLENTVPFQVSPTETGRPVGL